MASITIKIPEERIEEVMARFAEMGLTSSTNETTLVENEQKNEYFDAEVKSIIDHKVDKSGNFSFLINWGKKFHPTWIEDSNCFCEETISEYLQTKGINTTYIICRVSTLQQAMDKKTSLNSQEAALVKKAKDTFSERIKVVKTTASAYRSVPRNIQTVFDSCHRGDRIMVYRIDRLSRNITKLIPLLNTCDKNGVDIYSLEEDISYTKNKSAFLQSVLDAQKESDMMRKRQLQRIAFMKDKGVEWKGRLPYGKMYKKVGKNKFVVDDKVAMSRINFIKDQRRYKCDRLIAEELNANKMYYRGKRWTARNVYYISGKNPGK